MIQAMENSHLIHPKSWLEKYMGKEKLTYKKNAKLLLRGIMAIKHKWTHSMRGIDLYLEEHADCWCVFISLPEKDIMKAVNKLPEWDWKKLFYIQTNVDVYLMDKEIFDYYHYVFE